MNARSLALTLALAAGCDGINSDPGNTADAGADSSFAGVREVMELEPNGERDQATQLPAGGGAFVIRGTCEDDTDNDYYDANTTLGGPYSVRLEWQPGSYDMMFDPEDGFSGGQTQSFTSPILASGQLTPETLSESPRPQFNIDCYNNGNPSGLTGLAYTLYLTLP